jgi:hypothetical protein
MHHQFTQKSHARDVQYRVGKAFWSCTDKHNASFGKTFNLNCCIPIGSSERRLLSRCKTDKLAFLIKAFCLPSSTCRLALRFVLLRNDNPGCGRVEDVRWQEMCHFLSCLSAQSMSIPVFFAFSLDGASSTAKVLANPLFFIAFTVPFSELLNFRPRQRNVVCSVVKINSFKSINNIASARYEQAKKWKSCTSHQKSARISRDFFFAWLVINFFFSSFCKRKQLVCRFSAMALDAFVSAGTDLRMRIGLGQEARKVH